MDLPPSFHLFIALSFLHLAAYAERFIGRSGHSHALLDFVSHAAYICLSLRLSALGHARPGSHSLSSPRRFLAYNLDRITHMGAITS